MLSAGFLIAIVGFCATVRAEYGSLEETCSELPLASQGIAFFQGPAKKVAGTAVLSAKPLQIPLERMESCSNTSERHFYVGNISVGYPPQKFRVLFDTTSGHLILPHKVCKSPACQTHRTYDSWRSTTSVDLNIDGSRLRTDQRLVRGKVTREAVTVELTTPDLGRGSAQSVLVHERVCVNGAAKLCTGTGILASITQDDVPFRVMPSDGVVGLGLPPLAEGPALSFLNQLFKSQKDLKPQFGFSMGPKSGLLHIGGHPAVETPIRWFPVHSPEEGFWQVPVLAVKVGGVVVDDCHDGCHALIDTSADRLGVQKESAQRLRKALVPFRTTDGACHGPELEFDLGKMSVSLGAQDYVTRTCELEIGEMTLPEQFTGIFTFGETVLRHYYVAFDWQNLALGFAPSVDAEHVPEVTV